MGTGGDDIARYVGKILSIYIYKQPNPKEYTIANPPDPRSRFELILHNYKKMLRCKVFVLFIIEIIKN